MSTPIAPRGCTDCEASSLSRREFLKTTAGGVAAAAAASAGILTIAPPRLLAAESAAARQTSETLVTSLFKTFNEEQKKALCFSFDDPLRLKVDNNWFITKKGIGEVLNKDQQAMVKDIFMGMHSDEYAQKVFDQVEHDGGGKGTFEDCSIALFGEPNESGSGRKSKFEFVLTGRHCTRRCDGDSVEGAAFGGPIFYGHAAESFNEKPDHPGNAYWFQALRANEAFKALDGKQQKLALCGDPRGEHGTDTVKLTGKKSGLDGVPLSELSADQKELVRKVMADLLAPFRKADADEALKLIEAGGFDNLHMAFYKNADIGNDGVWDVWQIEGPAMLWYFRGAPHVHTWVNVRDPAKV